MNIQEFFQENKDEFLKFEKVEHKLSTRPDLHAFLLLDKLFPSDDDMVAAAEHDQIWLSIEPEDLGEIATKEQLLELCRAGVFYDEEVESLSMFV